MLVKQASFYTRSLDSSQRQSILDLAVIETLSSNLEWYDFAPLSQFLIEIIELCQIIFKEGKKYKSIIDVYQSIGKGKLGLRVDSTNKMRNLIKTCDTWIRKFIQHQQIQETNLQFILPCTPVSWITPNIKNSPKAHLHLAHIFLIINYLSERNKLLLASKSSNKGSRNIYQSRFLNQGETEFIKEAADSANRDGSFRLD